MASSGGSSGVFLGLSSTASTASSSSSSCLTSFSSVSSFIPLSSASSVLPSNSSISSFEDCRLSTGSQVLSDAFQPFHLTKYSTFPSSDSRLETMVSTSYSASAFFFFFPFFFFFFGLGLCFCTLIITLIKLVSALLRLKGFEVGSHIIVSFGLCQLDQDTRSTLALAVPADGAIAEASARRTSPCWIEKCLLAILPVANLNAAAAKLTTYTNAAATPADGFRVCGLLSALMASCADGLVVDLLPKTLADLVQHRLRYVFRHQHIFIGINLARPWRPFSGPVLISLVV